jgi:putative transposase
MVSFRNIYTSLMLVIARSTEKELARQLSYLKVENQILRSRLPDKLSLTEREKNRLVRQARESQTLHPNEANLVTTSDSRRRLQLTKRLFG